VFPTAAITLTSVDENPNLFRMSSEYEEKANNEPAHRSDRHDTKYVIVLRRISRRLLVRVVFDDIGLPGLQLGCGLSNCYLAEET
jgi:hypothetical protein